MTDGIERASISAMPSLASLSWFFKNKDLAKMKVTLKSIGVKPVVSKLRYMVGHYIIYESAVNLETHQGLFGDQRMETGLLYSCNWVLSLVIMHFHESH